jgi:hypothetical protein
MINIPVYTVVKERISSKILLGIRENNDIPFEFGGVSLGGYYPS